MEETGDGPVGALMSCESCEGTGLELGLEFLDGDKEIPVVSPVGVSVLLLFSMLENKKKDQIVDTIILKE